MSTNRATHLKRLLRLLLGVSLLVMGPAQVGLSRVRAEIRYNGGFVRPPRPRDDDNKKTPSKATAPKTPGSYSPDNDLHYSSPNAEAEAEHSQSPPARLPSGLSVVSFPWNRPDFEDYNDTLPNLRDTSLAEPAKYSLETATLRPTPRRAQTQVAGLVAHLPEHALLWVEGTRTRLTGRTRYFQSPPLKPGHKYHYEVRAVWIEDGHWVSQTQSVPVEAGRIEAIYLQHRPR